MFQWNISYIAGRLQFNMLRRREYNMRSCFVPMKFSSSLGRKWKHSARDNNANRITVHLVAAFEDRGLASFRRDELQDLLDAKAPPSPSRSAPIISLRAEELDWRGATAHRDARQADKTSEPA
jgi:hypothetical protein